MRTRRRRTREPGNPDGRLKLGGFHLPLICVELIMLIIFLDLAASGDLLNWMDSERKVSGSKR